MDNELFHLFGWWIAVIEIPILSALFWMVSGLRDNLADYKVEVARTYAQTSDLRNLENRITSHLLRIEAKLDVTALKAEKNS